MTFVDVLYRYEFHPPETAMSALAALKEVYGIRRIALDEQAKTVRVEYDATRLNRSSIAQMLRRGGISVIAEVPLIPEPKPEQAPDASEVAQPTK